MKRQQTVASSISYNDGDALWASGDIMSCVKKWIMRLTKQSLAPTVLSSLVCLDTCSSCMRAYS